MGWGEAPFALTTKSVMAGNIRSIGLIAFHVLSPSEKLRECIHRTPLKEEQGVLSMTVKLATEQSSKGKNLEALSLPAC